MLFNPERHQMSVTRGISNVGKKRRGSLRDDSIVKRDPQAAKALLTLHYMGALTNLWVDWLDSDTSYDLPKSVLTELRSAERVGTVDLSIPSTSGAQEPVPVTAFTLTAKNRKALDWLLRNDKATDDREKALANISKVLAGQIAEITDTLFASTAVANVDAEPDGECIGATDIGILILLNGSGRHQASLVTEAMRTFGIREEEALRSLARLLDYMFVDVGSSMIMSLSMKDTSQLLFSTTSHGKRLLGELARGWIRQGKEKTNLLSHSGIVLSEDGKLAVGSDYHVSRIKPDPEKTVLLSTFV